MKRSYAVIVFITLAEVAAAQTVPLPRPRPYLDSDEAVAAAAAATPTPSACRLRLTVARAIAPSVDRIDGPEGCGSADLVRLEAVMLPNKDRVQIAPRLCCDATWPRRSPIGCEMIWRDLGLLSFGSQLRSVRNYAAYHCRSRNNIVGGVASEHGKGNALDVGSITLVNGTTIDPTDLKVSAGLPGALEKKRVCPLLDSARPWVRRIP